MKHKAYNSVEDQKHPKEIVRITQPVFIFPITPPHHRPRMQKVLMRYEKQTIICRTDFKLCRNRISKSPIFSCRSPVFSKEILFILWSIYCQSDIVKSFISFMGNVSSLRHPLSVSHSYNSKDKSCTNNLLELGSASCWLSQTFPRFLWEYL